MEVKLKNDVLNLLEEIADYSKYGSVYDEDIKESLFKIKDKITPFIQPDRKSLKNLSAVEEESEAKTSFKNSKIENDNYLSRRYGYKSSSKNEYLSTREDVENKSDNEAAKSKEGTVIREQVDFGKVKNTNEIGGSLDLSTGDVEIKQQWNKSRGGTKHVTFQTNAAVLRLDETDIAKSSELEEFLDVEEKKRGNEDEVNSINADTFIDRKEARNDSGENDEFDTLINPFDNQAKIGNSNKSEVQVIKAFKTNVDQCQENRAKNKMTLTENASDKVKVKPNNVEAFPLACWQNVVEELEQELRKRRNSFESNVHGGLIDSGKAIASIKMAAVQSKNEQMKSTITESLPTPFAENVIDQLKTLFKMKSNAGKDNHSEVYTLKDKVSDVKLTQTNQIQMNTMKNGKAEVVKKEKVESELVKNAYFLVMEELEKKLREKQNVELRKKSGVESGSNNEVRLSVIDVLERLEVDDGYTNRIKF